MAYLWKIDSSPANLQVHCTNLCNYMLDRVAHIISETVSTRVNQSRVSTKKPNTKSSESKARNDGRKEEGESKHRSCGPVKWLSVKVLQGSAEECFLSCVNWPAAGRVSQDVKFAHPCFTIYLYSQFPFNVYKVSVPPCFELHSQ